MKNKKLAKTLLKTYNALYKTFGKRRWWPGDTKLEIIIGAILTQNTSWSNVEKAIGNLKKEGLLKARGLYDIPEKKLSRLIRPAGYYNVKSKRIKIFLSFLNTEYDLNINKMFAIETECLRQKLLNVNGIGQETADSILLYAGNKPIFVVDAYTKRILLRHGLVTEEADYKTIQNLFMVNLPNNVKLFNEFHALIVELGKKLCKRTKPLCGKCPIRRIKYA